MRIRKETKVDEGYDRALRMLRHFGFKCSRRSTAKSMDVLTYERAPSGEGAAEAVVLSFRRGRVPDRDVEAFCRLVNYRVNSSVAVAVVLAANVRSPALADHARECGVIIVPPGDIEQTVAGILRRLR